MGESRLRKHGSVSTPAADEVPLEGRGLRRGLYLYRLSAGDQMGKEQLVVIP
jgi:hypothetical protein